MVDMPGLTSLSDADLNTLRSAVIAEQQRRVNLASLPDQMQQWTDIYAAALAASPQQPTEYSPGTVYGPGQLVTYQGQTWRNSSNGALHDTTPGDAEHPFWVLVTDTATVTEWTTSAVLHPGDVYTYQGHTWRYTGTGGLTNDPNAAPANNAAWQQIA